MNQMIKGMQINTGFNAKANINPFIEKSVIEMSPDNPEYGKIKLAKELDKCGIKLSTEIIRSILIRNKLDTTQKRAKVLEKMAKDGAKLNTSQIKVIELYKDTSVRDWIFTIIYVLITSS